MSEDLKCDVLIVGYGPVGMTCAALLAHQGLDVIAVELVAAPSCTRPPFRLAGSHA